MPRRRATRGDSGLANAKEPGAGFFFSARTKAADFSAFDITAYEEAGPTRGVKTRLEYGFPQNPRGLGGFFIGANNPEDNTGGSSRPHMKKGGTPMQDPKQPLASRDARPVHFASARAGCPGLHTVCACTR